MKTKIHGCINDIDINTNIFLQTKRVEVHLHQQLLPTHPTSVINSIGDQPSPRCGSSSPLLRLTPIRRCAPCRLRGS